MKNNNSYLINRNIYIRLKQLIIMTTNLSNEITGLTGLGADLGGFFSGIAPGLVAFIVVLGIGCAVVAIIMAIVYVIKEKMKF